jgi:GTP-binding protein Era
MTTTLYEDDRGWFRLTDTPGVMGKVDDLMGKKINTIAPKSIKGAEIVVALVDISRPKNEEDNKTLALARKAEAKKILVFNKMDKAVGSKDHRNEYLYWEDEFDKSIEVSSIRDKFVKGLVNIIFELLPESNEEIERKNGPQMAMGSNLYISEIIREKVYLCLREELPYSTDVEVLEVKDKRKLIYVRANILTNATRYKKMIIGREGRKIKQIGHDARKELEIMSGRKIFLDLEVKVDHHWQEKISY